MSDFKVLSLKELGSSGKDVRFSTHISGHNQEGAKIEYLVDSAKVTFKNGKVYNIDLERINGAGGNVYQRNESRYSQKIINAISGHIDDEICGLIETLINSLKEKLEECCDTGPSLSEFKYKQDARIDQFLDFYDSFARVIDYIFIHAKERSVYHQSLEVAFVSRPEYEEILKVRQKLSDLKKLLDEKISAFLKKGFDQRIVTGIYKMAIKKFLTQNENLTLLEAAELEGAEGARDSFIPFSVIKHKDPALFISIIKKNNKRVNEVISGVLNHQLEADNGVYGRIYIADHIENAKILEPETSYTHNLFGLNYKIDNGTFRIHDLCPDKFSQPKSIESPIITRCFEEDLKSKKLNATNCFTDFDLEISHYVALENKRSIEIGKMKISPKKI